MGSYNTFYYNERLEKERNEFLKWKKTISCDGNPQRGDSVWNIIMDGPADSPYNGGKFKIEIDQSKFITYNKPVSWVLGLIDRGKYDIRIFYVDNNR